MTKTVWVLVCLLAASHVCDAYRILVIFPLPGKSHSILGDGVVRHLVNAGHEVSYVTPFPKEKHHPNLRQIDLSANSDVIPAHLLNISNIISGNLAMDNIYFMTDAAIQSMERENFKKLMENPNEHFDLIIAEFMFSEIYAGLAPIFNAPFIWFSTIEPNGLTLSLVDEYLNPSYNTFSSAATPPFTFTERIYELGFISLLSFVNAFVLQNQHLHQIREYQRFLVPFIEQKGRVAPSFDEVKFNASLILGNSHVSMGQATRLPQNYKAIGGFHIEDNIKPLPADLQKLMDESKNGVIYFSLGSNMKSKDLPNEIKKDLLQMFGSLKQTVFWKFEEVTSNLPKNVHILEWAPQQSILSHPNCLLFITHGGLLSTTESIHTGVPIIGIPIFADQFTNVKRAESKGFAKTVDLSYTMAGELKTAIEEMISDPKYRQKVKELSFVYHDRPVKPGAELVHWAEHVIKTRGAPHLRSPALLVPWYQKYYLDLVVLLLIAAHVLKRIFKFVKSLVISKKADAVKQKKNN